MGTLANSSFDVRFIATDDTSRSQLLFIKGSHPGQQITVSKVALRTGGIDDNQDVMFTVYGGGFVGVPT